MRVPRVFNAYGDRQSLCTLIVHVLAAPTSPEGQTHFTLVSWNPPARAAVAIQRASLVDVILHAGSCSEKSGVPPAALVVELLPVVLVAAVVAPVLPVPALAAAAVLVRYAHKLIQFHRHLLLGRFVGVHAPWKASGHPSGLRPVRTETSSQNFTIGQVVLVGVGYADTVHPPPSAWFMSIGMLLLDGRPSALLLDSELQVGAVAAE
mmetsp:Transcript_41959/g.97145  ORF Transcript_41959/g.97145 Transcript_41959/m.97145 type:complete len:207 (-) Transcript_41959:687-1307(-)